jgi:Protein of unknwon function (DUF3310)
LEKLGEDMPTHKSSDDEKINHPKHYNQHPANIECIEVVEHFSFNVGNAIKYLWRAGLKSSDPVEDIKKATWYCVREMDRLEKFRKKAKKSRANVKKAKKSRANVKKAKKSRANAKKK